jgi:DNA primase
VHATRQFYHCFGCGLSGDVFSFVQKIENITFPEAVRMIAQKLGIPIPKASYSTPGEAKEARLRGQLLDVHERAVAFFQECLRRPEGARAREYLIGRGLNEEMIAKFRIGYAPDSGFLLRDRLKGEFSEEVLRESGLFSWKEAASSELRASSNQTQSDEEAPRQSTEVLRAQKTGPQDDKGGDSELEAHSSKLAAMYSKFRNRIMFPIASEAGKVIAFTGLSTDERPARNI